MQENDLKIDLAEKEAIITITHSHSTTFITPKQSSAQEFLFALFSRLHRS